MPTYAHSFECRRPSSVPLCAERELCATHQRSIHATMRCRDAGANVLRVIPVYGLKFAFNDTFKTLVAGPEKKKLGPADLMWIGTLAGLFQTIVTYPLELIRTRLTLGVEQGGIQYKGIIDCVRQVLRSEGVPGL